MALSLRLATMNDLPALLDIGRQFFEYNPFKLHSTLVEEDLETMLEVLMDAPNTLIVGTFEDKVVATVGAIAGPLFWDHEKLHALELFWWVNPEHRTAGTGLALMAEMERRLRANGVKFACMVAMESSSPAEVGRLYERAGYTKTETTYMKVL